jgi:superfamily II DNA or RNA helicase
MVKDNENKNKNLSCEERKNELKNIYEQNNCYQEENEYNPECNEFLMKKELIEQECDFGSEENDNYFLYPDLNDKKFTSKIAVKKEFNEYKYDGNIPNSKEEFMEIVDKEKENLTRSKEVSTDFELQPHQNFIRNFMSFQTPYNGILLYHGLGTGKTCSAIGVAEETRTYMKQMGLKKAILIVASKNVQDNFRLQLFDERKLKNEGGVWNISSCIGNKLLREINPVSSKNLSKEKVVLLIESLIKKSYKFLGYVQFANYIIKTAKGITIEDIENIEEIDDILPEKGFVLDKDTIRKLSDEFDGRLIIIDEIHNIRDTDDNKENKVVSTSLDKLVKSAHNMRLILLSATPMYNSPTEIVWMLNILNMNDRRGKIVIKDVFDSKGNLLKESGKGKELLVRKATGYVSFVRGENPYTFPYRVYPNIFSPKDTFPLKKDIENNELTESNIYPSYPSYQINGKEIKNRDRIISIYLTHLKDCNGCGECQRCGYKYIIHSLKEKHLDSFENMESFGYTLVQKPSESLIITYPSSDLKNWLKTLQKENKKGEKSKNQTPVDISTLTGKKGLIEIMNFKDTISSPKEKGSFEYKKEILEKYGRIFSREKHDGENENIGKYSAKIKKILDIISPENKPLADGIVLIYSQYLDAGIIPMALALEEAGFSRFSDFGAKNLFKNKPTIHNKSRNHKFTYSMITGDSRLSPDNDSEIKEITNENNLKNGDVIKVVLISRAGSEGIDLKCIRQVHVLDAWYNMNLIEQVIGRAVRNNSHKSLPFDKRNVQIFLHGTLIDGTEEEAIDLYLYRKAETKAIQIGEVTRILKESAVDCIINQEQTEFTQEKFTEKIGVVTQILSDGQEIKDFKIGDAPYSPSNDYMPSGDYKCVPLLDKEDELKLKNIIESGDENESNKDTYTEPFVMMNIDKIIDKIKMLMKDQYFYKRNDLFKLLSSPKKYATIEEIYTALSILVEESSEIITDKYGRPGTLVNIGEYYLFQPLELKDKGLSIFERSTPVDYKHRMIRFDISDMKGIEVEHETEEEKEQMEKEVTNIDLEKETKNDYMNVLNECMKNFLLAVKYFEKNKLLNQRNENMDTEGGGRKKKEDKENELNEVKTPVVLKEKKVNHKEKEKLTDEELWYKHFGQHIDIMNDRIINISIVKLFTFLTEHIIESLIMEDKVNLLQYIYLNKEKYKNVDIQLIEKLVEDEKEEEDENEEKMKKWTDMFCKLSYDYFEYIKIAPDVRGKTKKLEYQLFFTNKSSEFKLWVLDKNTSVDTEKVWNPTDKFTDIQNVQKSEKYKENINISNNRYNEIIGFIGFEKNKYEMSFKTKRDMKEMTDKKRGNPGAKCFDARKENTVEMINELLGKQFIKVVTENYTTTTGVEKEKEKTYILKKDTNDKYVKDDSYNKISCCVLLETILRNKQSLNKDTNNNMVWFLTPENALLQNLYKIIEK